MAEIELRPLTLGELLDQTFSLYRKHFLLFVGIMAAPMLIVVAMNLLLFGVSETPLPDLNTANTPEARQAAALMVWQVLLGVWVMGLIYWVVYGIALGATTIAVSEVYLGRTTTIRHAYDSIRGKILEIIGLLIAGIVIIFAALIGVVFAAGIVAAVAVPFITSLGPVWTVIAGVIAALALVAVTFGVMILLSLSFSVSLPALMLENAGIIGSLKRSFALTRGRRRYIFVIGLLTTIITYIAAFVFQGPFWLATAVVWGLEGSVPFWMNSLAAVAGGLGMAVSGPLIMIALVLFYYDLRVRKEAFDIQLMMQALDRVSGSPAPEPPPAGTAP